MSKKNYYKKNKVREYYKNNIDIISNRSKEYYINNKELVREHARNNYKSLTEDKKQKMKEYQKEYKEI